MPTGNGILSEWVFQYSGKEGFHTLVFSVILIFIQAVFLNELVSNYRMSRETTLFPGLFYSFLICCFPACGNWSPVLFGNTFLLLAFSNLFACYKKTEVADYIFNAGFCLSLASLFYFPFILFVVMGTIGLNILRAFRIKERLMLFSGTLVPYVLTGVYYFWRDDLLGFWQRQVTSNLGFMDFGIVPGWEKYAKLGFFGMLVILSILSSGRFIFKKNIQVQKYVSILFWALLFGGLSSTIQLGLTPEHILIIAVPLAVFLSFSFVEMPQKMAEGFHLLLLFMAFFFQYKVLFGL